MKEEAGDTSIVSFLLIFALAAVLAVAIFSVLEATIFTEHALTSHARDIPAIKNCFDNEGNSINRFSSDYGRWAERCGDPDTDSHVFWRIFVCAGKDQLVITQFKQAANRMLNWMLNHDMQPAVGTSAC